MGTRLSVGHKVAVIRNAEALRPVIMGLDVALDSYLHSDATEAKQRHEFLSQMIKVALRCHPSWLRNLRSSVFMRLNRSNQSIGHAFAILSRLRRRKTSETLAHPNKASSCNRINT